MSKRNNIMSADHAEIAIDEALTRLERALSKGAKQGKASTSEQAVYIEQLEIENKKLAREHAQMKKNCIALKNGYETLEKKCKKLENANDSAEKELVSTLNDLDQVIARKSLH